MTRAEAALRRAVERAGGCYVGVQPRRDKGSLLLFNAPTGSTLSINLEGVIAAAVLERLHPNLRERIEARLAEPPFCEREVSGVARHHVQLRCPVAPTEPCLLESGDEPWRSRGWAKRREVSAEAWDRDDGLMIGAEP